MCTYKDFLPSVVGLIATKEKSATSPIIRELEGFAAVAFMDTVTHFARETKELTTVIAIDFYEGETHYPILAPKGFILQEVVSIADNSNLQPQFDLTDDRLSLKSCPEADLDRALFVTIAMIPDFTAGTCEVPNEFCVKYREEILNGMVSRLAAQKSQTWYDLELSRQHLGQYNEGVKDTKTKIIHRHADASKGNANKFLAAVMAGLTHDDNKIILEESEVLSAVTTAFRDTVIDVARETGLYRMDVAISLYHNTTRYPITPPDNHHLRDIVDVKRINMPHKPHKHAPREVFDTPHPCTRCNQQYDSFGLCGCEKQHAHQIHPKSHHHHHHHRRPRPMFGMPKVIDDTIHVDPPPCNDIERALMVTIALIPTHEVCEFDNSFVDLHYELILSGIRMRLSMQGGKQWANLGVYDRLKREHTKKIAYAKRRNHGQPIKSKEEPLSSQWLN